MATAGEDQHELTHEKRADGFRYGTCSCGWESNKHALAGTVWRDFKEHLAQTSASKCNNTVRHPLLTSVYLKGTNA